MNTEQIKLKISQSISLKLMVIFFLIILMQIPLSYVRGLINERQSSERQAQYDIGQRWGQSQYIGTPMATTEFDRHTSHIDSTGSQANYNQTFVQSIYSKNTEMSIQLIAEKRYLGIYEAVIYKSEVALKGIIDVTNKHSTGNAELQFFIPIKHSKGLKSINRMMINGTEVAKELSEKKYNEIYGVVVDLSEFKDHKTLDYDIHLSFVGSQQLEILPMARSTQVSMQSNWHTPSFVGDALPDERNISEEGFTAQWRINNLTQSSETIKPLRQVQDRFSYQESGKNFMSFGVKTLIAANVYQVNERTVKYSILIILLTFAAFFLAELFFNIRLHPFQYLMIGVSLSLFYLLLLSFSEFLYFDYAFLLAAIFIIVVISGYCSVILKNRKRGLMTAVLFSLLYAFIFVLVKAEQTSLLMGALGLWLALAMVMYLTRKIDWYAIHSNRNEKAELQNGTVE